MDSSAIVAILKGEPGAERIATKILSADRPRMSAANWLEATMVADGRAKPEIMLAFEAVMAEFDIEIVPFDAEQAKLARTANLRFGRGRHQARLNYGDCMAYALAKQTDEPLLFIGNDFTHTDITPALA